MRVPIFFLIMALVCGSGFNPLEAKQLEGSREKINLAAILVIVIEEYPPPFRSLRYTEEDGRNYRRFFEECGVQPSRIRLLTTATSPDSLDWPSRNNIITAFTEWLPQYARGGPVLIIFSGHGSYQKDTGFLAPYDIKPLKNGDVDPETLLKMSWIAWQVAPLPVPVVTVLDCCYAAAARTGPQDLTSAKGSLGSNGTWRKGPAGAVPKGLPQAKAILPRESLFEDFVDQCKPTPTDGFPRVFMGACRPDQRAWESEELRRSIYSYFFLEAFTTRADVYPDGKIEPKEIFDYVSRKVEAYTSFSTDAKIDVQTPVSTGYFGPIFLGPAIPVGTICISSPSPAEVYLDGRWVGQTPLTIDCVRCGEHRIRLEFRQLGAKPLEKIVHVEEDQTCYVPGPTQVRGSE